MAFSTTSYLAGVGSVVAALTIGFSGGFFLAAPTQNDPPNRLQRVTSSAPLPNPAPPQAATAPKQDAQNQETAEAAAPAQAPVAVPAAPAVAAPPAPVVAAGAPVSPPATLAQQAAPVEPTPAPPSAREPEPTHAAAAQERTEKERIAQLEKARAAEASRAAEKKRIEARKLAERRKHREIQEAAAAVKRMLRDRDVQQVADTDDSDRRGFDPPPFGFFGQ